MRRIALLAVLLMLAGLVYAGEPRHGSTKLTIDPSEMKNGETKTLVDGDKTITLKKDGDSLDIKIEGGGKTRSITLSHSGDGAISIYRDGALLRTMPEMHGGPRIFVDGRESDGGMQHFFERRPEPAQTWFVCPKDHTILRVPEEKAGESFKCPVDGTQMEKRKGRGFAFFFDREEHL